MDKLSKGKKIAIIGLMLLIVLIIAALAYYLFVYKQKPPKNDSSGNKPKPVGVLSPAAIKNIAAIKGTPDSCPTQIKELTSTNDAVEAKINVAITQLPVFTLKGATAGAAAENQTAIDAAIAQSNIANKKAADAIAAAKNIQTQTNTTNIAAQLESEKQARDLASTLARQNAEAAIAQKLLNEQTVADVKAKADAEAVAFAIAETAQNAASAAALLAASTATSVTTAQNALNSANIALSAATTPATIANAQNAVREATISLTTQTKIANDAAIVSRQATDQSNVANNALKAATDASTAAQKAETDLATALATNTANISISSRLFDNYTNAQNVSNMSAASLKVASLTSYFSGNFQTLISANDGVTAAVRAVITAKNTLDTARTVTLPNAQNTVNAQTAVLESCQKTADDALKVIISGNGTMLNSINNHGITSFPFVDAFSQLMKSINNAKNLVDTNNTAYVNAKSTAVTNNAKVSLELEKANTDLNKAIDAIATDTTGNTNLQTIVNGFQSTVISKIKVLQDTENKGYTDIISTLNTLNTNETAFLKSLENIVNLINSFQEIFNDSSEAGAPAAIKAGRIRPESMLVIPITNKSTWKNPALASSDQDQSIFTRRIEPQMAGLLHNIYLYPSGVLGIFYGNGAQEIPLLGDRSSILWANASRNSDISGSGGFYLMIDDGYSRPFSLWDSGGGSRRWETGGAGGRGGWGRGTDGKNYVVVLHNEGTLGMYDDQGYLIDKFGNTDYTSNNTLQTNLDNLKTIVTNTTNVKYSQETLISSGTVAYINGPNALNTAIILLNNILDPRVGLISSATISYQTSLWTETTNRTTLGIVNGNYDTLRTAVETAKRDENAIIIALQSSIATMTNTHIPAARVAQTQASTNLTTANNTQALITAAQKEAKTSAQIAAVQAAQTTMTVAMNTAKAAVTTATNTLSSLTTNLNSLQNALTAATSQFNADENILKQIAAQGNVTLSSTPTLVQKSAPAPSIAPSIAPSPAPSPASGSIWNQFANANAAAAAACTIFQPNADSYTVDQLLNFYNIGMCNPGGMD
jgi:hypothetical protein